jgi:hypothetical protein
LPIAGMRRVLVLPGIGSRAKTMTVIRRIS